MKRPFLFITMCVRDEHDLSDLMSFAIDCRVRRDAGFRLHQENHGNEADHRNTTLTTLTENLSIGVFDRDGVGFGVRSMKIFGNQIVSRFLKV